MIDKARIHFALPKSLYDDIKKISEEQGISMATFIKLACIDYIKKVKK